MILLELELNETLINNKMTYELYSFILILIHINYY